MRIGERLRYSCVEDGTSHVFEVWPVPTPLELRVDFERCQHRFIPMEDEVSDSIWMKCADGKIREFYPVSTAYLTDGRLRYKLDLSPWVRLTVLCPKVGDQVIVYTDICHVRIVAVASEVTVPWPIKIGSRSALVTHWMHVPSPPG